MLHTVDSNVRLFPPLGLGLIRKALLIGVAADIGWEIWARFLVRFWIGGPLEPAGLVQAVFGLQERPIAELIHAVVGVLLYPLGYLLVARPLQRLIVPGLPTVLVGLGFGTGLWVFALYVMAHLFAGFPAFLGFGSITWASLVGHWIYGIVAACTARGIRA